MKKNKTITIILERLTLLQCMQYIDVMVVIFRILSLSSQPEP